MIPHYPSVCGENGCEGRMVIRNIQFLYSFDRYFLTCRHCGRTVTVTFDHHPKKCRTAPAAPARPFPATAGSQGGFCL
jgi:hypothetical protein